MVLPVFRDLQLFIFGDVHPLLLMLQNLANRAPFNPIFDRDIFLPRVGILLVVQTNLFPVHVEQALFLVFTDHGGHISGRCGMAERIRCGGRRHRC